MRYYVTADVHGFYVLLKRRLGEAGFFTDTEPHRLLICGDLFDRGNDAKELQQFILDLMEKDEVILIRGNHEDLFERLVTEDAGIAYSFHRANGTYSTALQLTDFTPDLARDFRGDFVNACIKTPYFSTILPAMRNYYETRRFIFTHGWLPCRFQGETPVALLENWRSADAAAWNKARWINGMDAVRSCRAEKDVFCGHWHTSWGHMKYEHRGSEFGADADFSPYIAPGIRALDACTAYSGLMNIIVTEDEETV